MRRLNFNRVFPVLLAVALVGYFLPWISTSASSLSLGAYDLAEWSSLHPVIRQTVPFLWTTLALRVPLAILGILFATYISKTFHRRYIAIICLLVAAIALLPPLEFFTAYRDDPNYRQQFILALMTVVIGIPAIFGQPKKFQKGLLIALSILGVLASAIGLYQAQKLMQGFELHIAIGLGGVMTSVALAAVAYLYITKQSS
ncbi:MAG: hypothetical protein H0X30_21420 [Anaerolineae bacterium]|nr:hypothetical protein [Anaerolineae bacterium]